MSKKSIIIILLAVFLFPSSIFSKDKLKKYSLGYYVTNENDTIKGYLKDLTISESCIRIKFKKDNESSPIDLFPENVKSYMRGGGFFVSKIIGGEASPRHVFVKPIIEDELSLYRRWVSRENATSCEINNVTIPIYHRSDAREVQINYIQLPGQPMFRIRKLGFRQNISTYLSDNEVLAKRILNKEIKSFRRIIAEYNTWFRNKDKKTEVSTNLSL